jgi:sialate O-acetylesterase
MKREMILSLFIFFGTAALANIRLPAVLSSNMVLQQQSNARLWGWCDPGERVRVTTSWDHRTDSAKGTRDGKWEMEIPTPRAGGPYTIELKGGNTLVLDNVLVGEVWICSGQSNMEMSETWGLPDVKSELPSCYNSNIRFFHIPRTTSPYPQEDCQAHWAVCDSNELKSFSAVGYFFGKRLNKELNVAVGIVEVAWSGTPAEVWAPADMINGDDLLKNAAAKLTPADGWPYIPGYCFNGMIAPLTSFALAGAIWYQGEGNTSVPESYGKLFTTMIGSWRKAWNKPFPFYYVQIAPFTYGAGNAGGLLREQQANTMKLANTGMVVISDITGDTTNIHPKNKHDVGERLANWALAETYHRDGIVYKNPTYQGMVTKGNKIEVSVVNAPAGLVVKGSPANEVFVAGDDKQFYPAEARIDGSRLIVSSRQVKKPVAVRYQFDNAGVGNIFSKEGLPLAPFRTDDW